MNHEKNEKHKKRVPPTVQTVFKVVKTSSSKVMGWKWLKFRFRLP